jgi:predicted permease
MATLREWIIRFWGTLRPGRRDAELEAELRLHLELAAEHEQRRVSSTEEARRAAAIRFGGVAQSMEAVRDQRRLPWLNDLGRDLRYALRALRRNPMFASVAVVTLALGIGANTAIFSLADAVLLRPLPVATPQGLVVLRQVAPAGTIFPFTAAAAEDLALSTDVLSGLAAFRPLLSTHVGVNGDTELALVQSVSGNYHAVLGIQAVTGRTLTEHDREPVAVISHRYWQRRFAGDPNVVGRALEMHGRSFTIVGVTPREFFGTQPGRYVDVTAPLSTHPMTMPPNARWLYLVGRLSPGISREQARVALRARWTQLAVAPSPRSRPAILELDSGAQGLNELGREFSLPLRILMAAVGVVLLVACANLAGLLIARSSARQQEIAIRLSLGAARGRIVRQLLTESALVAAAGGAAGGALAYWLTPLLLAMMSRGRGAIVLDVAPNARTLTFTAAITIATALLFGLLPALGASRTTVQSHLKQSASGADRTRRTWGRAMVVTQVALLVLLLTSAGLFARTLQKLRSVDAGFTPAHVLVVSVSTGPAIQGATRRALYEDLYARFSALPGVRSVSMAMDIPIGDLSMAAGMAVPGRPSDVAADAAPVYHNFAGPHFFETMGIAVLSGRDFDLSDDERALDTVVVSDGVARRYFAHEDPLGRQIVVGDPQCRRCPAPSVATIVGVVRDVRYTSLRADAPLMIYRPSRQAPNAPADTFLIRTSSASADSLRSLLHAEVRAAAPALPPPSVVSLDDRVAGALVEERMLAALSSAIGVLAALLAAIGIYSTVASAVARRQREIGIRIALGALPGRVARSVVGEAFRIVAGGLAIGFPAAIAAALAARSLLAGLLFELAPTDPLIFTSSMAAILLVASLAAYVPARRAARIDPVVSLKYE